MVPQAVFHLDDASAADAVALSDEFSLPVIDASATAGATQKERLRFLAGHLKLPALAFLLRGDGLKLALIDEEQILEVGADFRSPTVDYRRAKGGGRSEMIAKAVGVKGQNLPSVIDATAGLGGDAFVLAGLGCEVLLLERSSAVSALVREELKQALAGAESKDPDYKNILNRMQLVCADSIEYLEELEEAECPDVIYLDPMFPERKKSAAVKKEMQLFHRLIGPDSDASRLFDSAMAKARNRVVVKRPRIAPAITERAASHTLEGKRNRYDVYLT